MRKFRVLRKVAHRGNGIDVGPMSVRFSHLSLNFYSVYFYSKRKPWQY